jgi:serine/threonine protein phosphatase PrpC
LATKQLRLDVAQLTDVGRKREHNEDNMAYVIPKDPQVMAKKGALFIVADGMGGHAAGEVASEIAVDTVSNIYYQDDSDEVATSLLHAIKRANALIHQRAAENMLRSGMGTTCVAAVLRGNMAYIANVGDSRAYIVHGGQVKQVSQDHSWVAEQVRAGLLTEDQARTHAQRNVITRCLGTQADVEIDVFPERIEEKDALVLCTDGLSGLVTDDEIRRIVDQSGPQESVYHLVELANENGGPDNITAIVVSVQEVGVEPPGVRRPAYVGGRENDDDTALPGLPSASPGATASAIFTDGRSSSAPLRYASGPLVSPESITAPQPVLQTGPRKRNRLFYPSLGLLLLFVIALLTGGGYLYLKATTNTNVPQKLKAAQAAITKARGEVAANPAAALHDFATAQTGLRALLTDSLTNDQHSKVLRLLQVDVTSGVQAAISSYDSKAAIASLPCTGVSATSPLNIGTTGTQVKTITLVPGKDGHAMLFAIGQDSKVYQVSNSSLIPVPALHDTRVLDIASYGQQLLLLTAQPASGTPTSYGLALLTSDQSKVESTTMVGPLVNGQLPRLIAASPPDIYVVSTANSTQTATTILDYAPTSKVHQPLGSPPAQSTITVSNAIMSMVAFPLHQLFLLLADGTVQSLQFAGSAHATTSVLLQQAIVQPLPVSAKDFTWQTTVPLVTPGGMTSLSVPGAALSHTLAVGLVNAVPHLYILDANLHRILDLKIAAAPAAAVGSTATTTSSATPTATNTGGGAVNTTAPVTLQLEKQYASPTLFAQAKSMAVDPQGTQVNVVAQTPANASAMLNLVSFNAGSKIGCT